MPLSETTSDAPSPVWLSSTTTRPPSGVNLIALLTRFITTRSSAGRVADDHHRIRRDIDQQVDRAHPDQLLEQLESLVDHVTQVDLVVRELELAGLHLRQREQVRHEQAETRGVALDPRDGVDLSLGEVAQAAVAEQLGVPRDAGDRGAQLVADVRDQLLLDVVDLLEPEHRGVLAVQRRQQGVLHAEPLGDVLAGADVADHGPIGLGDRGQGQGRHPAAAVLVGELPVASFTRLDHGEDDADVFGRYAEVRRVAGDLRWRVEHARVQAHHLFGGVPDELLGARVVVRDPADRVGRDDHGAARRVEQPLERGRRPRRLSGHREQPLDGEGQRHDQVARRRDEEIDQCRRELFGEARPWFRPVDRGP